MIPRRWLHNPWVAALASGVWLLALAVDRDPSIVISLVTAIVGVILLTRHPLLGVSLVVLTGVVQAVAGSAFGEIELLLLNMYSLFRVGRHHRSLLLGAILLAGVALSIGARPGAPWYGSLITAAIFCVPWMFGLVIRRRSRDAASAAAESARLAAINLSQVMSQSARAGRRRASGHALTVLRDSVERMCRLTSRALHEPPPDEAGQRATLDAVRLEAEHAIQRLHEILFLLKPAQDAQGALAGSLDEADDDIRPAWTLQAVLTCLAGVMLSLLVVYLAAGWHLPLLALAAVTPVAALLARWYVLPAGLAIGAAMALVVVVGASFDHWALLPIEVALAFFLWIAVGHRSLQTGLGVGAAVVGVLLMGAQFGKQGLGFGLVSVCLTLMASRAWRDKDDRLQGALLVAARRTAEIARAAIEAERAERARLARELHDGVSHGITAMTMQVQAATAHLDHASSAANAGSVANADYTADAGSAANAGSMANAANSDHAASAERFLRLALEAGEQTLGEIDAITNDWLSPSGGDEAREHLDGLIDGARDLGLNVTHNAISEHVDALTYRIVQEALTNIVRYAPGARVLVETGSRDGQYSARVVDTGPARATDQLHNELPGLGTGLAGLAARVGDRAGTFRAGRYQNGFEVAASWPAAHDVPAAEFDDATELDDAALLRSPDSPPWSPGDLDIGPATTIVLAPRSPTSRRRNATKIRGAE